MALSHILPSFSASYIHTSAQYFLLFPSVSYNSSLQVELDSRAQGL